MKKLFIMGMVLSALCFMGNRRLQALDLLDKVKAKANSVFGDSKKPSVKPAAASVLLPGKVKPPFAAAPAKKEADPVYESRDLVREDSISIAAFDEQLTSGLKKYVDDGKEKDAPLPHKIHSIRGLIAAVEEQVHRCSEQLGSLRAAEVTKEVNEMKAAAGHLEDDLQLMSDLTAQVKAKKIPTNDEIKSMIERCEKIQQRSEMLSIALTVIVGIGSASTVVLTALGITVPIATATLVATITTVVGIIGKVTLVIAKVSEAILFFKDFDLTLIQDAELRGRVVETKKTLDKTRVKLETLDRNVLRPLGEKLKGLQVKVEAAQREMVALKDRVKRSASDVADSARKSFNEIGDKLTSLFVKKERVFIEDIRAKAIAQFRSTALVGVAAAKFKKKAGKIDKPIAAAEAK